VTVENGTAVTGRAAAVATALTDQGFGSGTTTANAPSPAATTTLTYGTGQKAEAQTVADALGLPASQLRQGSGTGLTLVIGRDWTSGTSYPGGASASSSPDGSSGDQGGDSQGGGSSSAPADTEAAVSNAHAQTALTKTCAKVSPYKTVSLNGVSMTPSQAYAAARDKPDSDR
jgi:hypothetical protein